MNWEYAARWQGLKDQEEGVKSLEKAIKTGDMEGAIGTVGGLETQRIQLEQQTGAAKEALDTFKVHPQYETIQQDADQLTKEIHDLVNLNITDRQRLERYQLSMTEERPPSSMSLEQLYEEFGLVFPDAVKRSMEEARSFHNQIIANRREFLEVEVKQLQQAIDGRESQIKDLTDRRAEVMIILQTHGALQEMTKLQERHVALQGSLDRVQARLKEMRELNTTKREVKTAKTEMAQTAEQDHEERRDLWSDATPSGSLLGIRFERPSR